MKTFRHYSLFDKICLKLDDALRALTDHPHTSGALYPAHGIEEPALSDAERSMAASLMRVNHAGEICAQALYHGQGMVSRDEGVQVKMRQAAIEEGDHLIWCKRRLMELGSHTSYLNPLWYAGSFCIGMLAGMVGDRWSLGFVAETEHQVIRHLEKHKKLLPKQDGRSYRILAQMKEDEDKHRKEAIASGARALPEAVKFVMTMTSKVMVNAAYRV